MAETTNQLAGTAIGGTVGGTQNFLPPPPPPVNQAALQGAVAGSVGSVPPQPLGKPTPVVTSNAAIQDVNKIKGTLDTITAQQKNQNNPPQLQNNVPPSPSPSQQFIGKEYVNGGMLQYGQTNPDGTRSELFTPNVADPNAQKTTPSTPTTSSQQNYNQTGTQPDAFERQLSEIQAQTDQAYNDYRTSITQLQNGTIPLTPEQQAQINAIQAQFDRIKEQQKVANKNYEGGMTQIGIASGRSRYAPEIAQGEIANAVNVGIQKISDIDAKAAETVATMKIAFQDKNFSLMKSMFESYNGYMKDKTDMLFKMKGVADQKEREMREFNFKATQMDMEQKRFAMELERFDAERKDKQLEYQQNLAGSIASQLVDLDENMNVQVQDWDVILEVAKDAGVDPNVLAGEMNKKAEELRKSSLEERKFKFDQFKYQSDQELDQAKFGLEKAKFNLDKWDKEFNQQLKMEELQAKGANYNLTGEQINDAVKKGYGSSEADLAMYARQIKDGINPAWKKEVSPEQKKLNANVMSAMDSLSLIQDKIGSGMGIGKVVDGEYKFAENNLVDVIGRLRSGGAIQADEEKRFKELLPSVLRTKETNENNLRELNKLLVNTMGIDNYNDEKKKVYSDINTFEKLASIQEKKEFEKIVRDAGVKPGDDMNDYLEAFRKKKGFNGPLSMGVKGSFEQKFPTGAPGGQCASFARKLVDIPPLGNGLNEKKAWVNKIGIPAAEWKNSPQVGDVIITDESKNYGHVAVVNRVLPDGRIQLTESNYNNDEKVHHNRIMSLNSPRIYGAIRKPLKTNIQSYAA